MKMYGGKSAIWERNTYTGYTNQNRTQNPHNESLPPQQKRWVELKDRLPILVQCVLTLQCSSVFSLPSISSSWSQLLASFNFYTRNIHQHLSTYVSKKHPTKF